MTYRIPLNKPYITGDEIGNIAECLKETKLSGDGKFTKRCQDWMRDRLDARHVLLTTSCTSALEMAALLCNVQPGDEVILPSYTFVSTANAFALRGAKLVFVDIRPDTLNMDEKLVEQALTDRTRVIVPVHYAGIGCEMDVIVELARSRGLRVVEDAAQAVNSKYKGRFLGTLGDFGAFSFHETKNFVCGEGGALVTNEQRDVERAEIVREKGTNRSKFFRGEVDKYTWVDVGSSYLPADILAAFLLAQLEHSEAITQRRRLAYEAYQRTLQPLADRGLLTLPSIPASCDSNFHMFYILVSDLATRAALLQAFKQQRILATFHYVPLHTSPVGLSMGYKPGMLPITESASDRVIRLPLYAELSAAEVLEVVRTIYSFYSVTPPVDWDAGA